MTDTLRSLGLVDAGGFFTWRAYFVMLPVSCLLRLLYHKLAWNVCAHSDGGGHDSGTSYSYVPRLKPGYSTMMDESTGYAAWNPRVRVLTWFLLIPCPVYWAIQVLEILHYLYLRAEYFFSCGELDSNVPDNCQF